MLNHKLRATRPDIEQVIKIGLLISGNFLYAKISKNNTEKLGFAIVISKKDEKTSVGRHFIKRKISSFIEDYTRQNTIGFKKTVVFFLKKTKTERDYLEIKKDVEYIFKKIA